MSFYKSNHPTQKDTMGCDLKIADVSYPVPCSRSNRYVTDGYWTVQELRLKIEELTLKSCNEKDTLEGNDLCHMIQAISVYSYALGKVKPSGEEDYHDWEVFIEYS